MEKFGFSQAGNVRKGMYDWRAQPVHFPYDFCPHITWGYHHRFLGLASIGATWRS